MINDLSLLNGIGHVVTLTTIRLVVFHSTLNVLSFFSLIRTVACSCRRLDCWHRTLQFCSKSTPKQLKTLKLLSLSLDSTNNNPYLILICRSFPPLPGLLHLLDALDGAKTEEFSSMLMLATDTMFLHSFLD